MMTTMAESGHPPTTGWPRPCNSCRSAPGTVYCRVDSAHFCTACDSRTHAANLIASRHERVWMCEVCGNSPATVTCKADSAALCSSCDATIHAANSLARRHLRVPILPVPAAGLIPFPGHGQTNEPDVGDEEEEEEHDWFLLDPVRNGNQNLEIDEFLDLGRFAENPEKISSKQKQQREEEHDECDGVVPVQFAFSDESNCDGDHEAVQPREYKDFKREIFGYTPPHMSHGVMVSSAEGGFIPGITVTGVPFQSVGPSKGTIDFFPGVQQPVMQPQVVPYMDREARVLRYREKRKMRKFEKTIRYASRKAYAEIRPRIKGRFAKRSEVDVEVEQLFSAAYGIVPSY